MKKIKKKEAKELVSIEPLEPIVPEVAPPMVPSDFKHKLTREQIDLIKTTIAKGASDDELKMLLYVCTRTGLDPFVKQIHLVPRWDGRLGKEVRSVIVGIDGLRSVAERTGTYIGSVDAIFQEETEITYSEGKETKKMFVPARATVTVKKIVQGIIGDFTASAEWSEYYPGDRQGFMWRKMARNMLGKCAEAKALRKGFPSVLSGLYVPEEMEQASQINLANEDKNLSARAKVMIGKSKDIIGLEDLSEKISQSKKYSDKDKEDLASAIEKRIVELKKDDIPIIEVEQ